VVDLSAFAGRTVDLRLITESTTPRALGPAYWSHPVIRASASAGMTVRDDDRPVWREIPVERLAAEPAGPIRLPRDVDLLKLSGEVVRLGAAPVSNEDVLFRVLAGGEPLFEHVLRPAARAVDFGRTLELPEGADRPETIELVIDVPERLRGRVRARWLQAVLVREAPVARQAAGNGPNLLFIVVDTLRADHLSLHGYHRETTPVLDRFARKSMVFDQAISPSSWTLPATASLMSGLAPPEHGVTGRPWCSRSRRWRSDCRPSG
jgi:hypothetical protein